MNKEEILQQIKTKLSLVPKKPGCYQMYNAKGEIIYVGKAKILQNRYESLITNLVGNRRSRVVAKAVIDICHQLGCSVLAESVETQDQLNVLQELGCDYAQGTLFNKPIKVESFEVRYLKE